MNSAFGFHCMCAVDLKGRWRKGLGISGYKRQFGGPGSPSERVIEVLRLGQVEEALGLAKASLLKLVEAQSPQDIKSHIYAIDRFFFCLNTAFETEGEYLRPSGIPKVEKQERALRSVEILKDCAEFFSEIKNCSVTRDTIASHSHKLVYAFDYAKRIFGPSPDSEAKAFLEILWGYLKATGDFQDSSNRLVTRLVRNVGATAAMYHRRVEWLILEYLESGTATTESVALVGSIFLEEALRCIEGEANIQASHHVRKAFQWYERFGAANQKNPTHNTSYIFPYYTRSRVYGWTFPFLGNSALKTYAKLWTEFSKERIELFPDLVEAAKKKIAQVYLGKVFQRIEAGKFEGLEDIVSGYGNLAGGEVLPYRFHVLMGAALALLEQMDTWFDHNDLRIGDSASQFDRMEALVELFLAWMGELDIPRDLFETFKKMISIEVERIRVSAQENSRAAQEENQRNAWSFDYSDEYTSRGSWKSETDSQYSDATYDRNSDFDLGSSKVRILFETHGLGDLYRKDEFSVLKGLFKYLMRRFHPDLAGNSSKKAEMEETAKRINGFRDLSDIQGMLSILEGTPPVSA